MAQAELGRGKSGTRAEAGAGPGKGCQHCSKAQERGFLAQGPRASRRWARILRSPAQASSTDCTVLRGGPRLRGHTNGDVTLALANRKQADFGHQQ